MAGLWQVLSSTGTAVNFDDLSFHIVPSGAGVAPIEVHSSAYGLLSGSTYESTRYAERTFLLTGTLLGSSQSDLHDKRLALIAALRPRLGQPATTVQLRYLGNSGKTLAINCRYAGGLEYAKQEGFSEIIPLRFVAHDPFWFDVTENSETLTEQATFEADYFAYLDEDGFWQHDGDKPDDVVWAIIDTGQGDGTVYVGGAFGSIGATSGYGGVAMFDPSDGSWTKLGAGADDGTVLALEVDPLGNLYAGGSFSGMQSKANTRGVARWTPGAFTWSALGTGLDDGACHALDYRASGGDGHGLYVAGTFTGAGGVANTSKIARYDAGWESVSSDLPNGTVRDVNVTTSNLIFIGGDFTSVGGEDGTSYLAAYTVQGLLLTHFNASDFITSTVYALGGKAYNPYGTTLPGLIYAATAEGVHEYHGGWRTLGGADTPNNLSHALATNAEGHLLAGGTFTEAGGLDTISPLAVWRGGVWNRFGVDLPIAVSTTTVTAVAYNSKGMIFIGHNGASGGTKPAGSVLTPGNSGNVDAYPVFTITGTSGVVEIYEISNFGPLSFVKQGLVDVPQTVYFGNLYVDDGETITITTGPGVAGVQSDQRGNLNHTVLPGSSLARFHLPPGSTSVSLYASSTSPTSEVSWHNRYLSFDA